MATDLGTYQAGETLAIRRQTMDVAGSLAAPTSLTFEVKPSGEDKETFVQGTDTEVEDIATGDYQLNYLLSEDLAGPVLVRITMVADTKTIVEHAWAAVEAKNVT